MCVCVLLHRGFIHQDVSHSPLSSHLQRPRQARLQLPAVRPSVRDERAERRGPGLPPGSAHLHRSEHRHLAHTRTGAQVRPGGSDQSH